jgi:hypothetical protein
MFWFFFFFVIFLAMGGYNIFKLAFLLVGFGDNGWSLENALGAWTAIGLIYLGVQFAWWCLYTLAMIGGWEPLPGWELPFGWEWWGDYFKGD